MVFGHLMEPVAPKGVKGAARSKLSVNIDDKLLAWVQANTGTGKRFDSTRHALESGLVALRDEKP